MVTEAARAAISGIGVLRAFARLPPEIQRCQGLKGRWQRRFGPTLLFVPGRVGDFGLIDFRFLIDGSFGIALGRGIIDRPHVFSTVDVGAAFCTTQSPCFKGLSGGSHEVRFFPASSLRRQPPAWRTKPRSTAALSRLAWRAQSAKCF